MKNRYLFKVGFACALLCASVVYTSCGDDDDPTPSNQNTSDEVALVSELKCTVAEFATKYTTLKKGEKVAVTLTDVSDANIDKVSETLKKMSVDPISKAGEAKYIVSLVLESVQNALKTIPADAFKGVEVLREVVIPACVEVIKNYSFAECVNLVLVKIQGEDTKVEEKAFENTNDEIKIEQAGKEEVVTPEAKLLSPAEVVDYVNASDEEVVTLNMALETYDHTEVMVEINRINDKKVNLMIPEGVKELTLEIGYVTSYHSPEALVGVDIPESVTSIGDCAFEGCSGLTSLSIPKSVTSIGSSAFLGCSGLTSITIPENVTTINKSTFRDCIGLTSITLPKKVTSIGDYAFNRCSALTSINIPENVTSIGWAVFAGCSDLTSITIPENVTSIGNSAFYKCTGLTSIIIPGGVTSIGEWAFYDCNAITSVIIPESVTVISDWAFEGCSALTSITIPGSVTSIGDEAFDNCDNLKTIYCSQTIYDEYHDQYPQMVVKE